MKTTCIKQKLLITAIAGSFLIPGSAVLVKAEDKQVLPTAGIETVLSECYTAESQHPVELYLVPTEKGEYSDMAFANVSDYAYIRSAPDETSDWVGKLYKDGAATVIETTETWTKVQSGNVTGFMPTEQLYTGGAAKEYAQQAGERIAKVTATVLNVRDGQGTHANILTQILLDQEYTITGDPVSGWYPLQVGDISGWVCGDYITTSDNFSYAESKEEEEARLAREAEEAAAIKAEEEAQAQAQAVQETVSQATTQQAASGQAVVDYACQFIGNPYVWGGTSLTQGADCSGFVQSVYQHFGISLPRTTWDMESAGYEVTYENALPGDIILYDGHVGLYMGDGTIVNAIDEAHGIGISNATFTNIITIRRMF